MSNISNSWCVQCILCTFISANLQNIIRFYVKQYFTNIVKQSITSNIVKQSITYLRIPSKSFGLLVIYRYIKLINMRPDIRSPRRLVYDTNVVPDIALGHIWVRLILACSVICMGMRLCVVQNEAQYLFINHIGNKQSHSIDKCGIHYPCGCHSKLYLFQ